MTEGGAEVGEAGRFDQGHEKEGAEYCVYCVCWCPAAGTARMEARRRRSRILCLLCLFGVPLPAQPGWRQGGLLLVSESRMRAQKWNAKAQRAPRARKGGAGVFASGASLAGGRGSEFMAWLFSCLERETTNPASGRFRLFRIFYDGTEAEKRRAAGDGVIGNFFGWRVPNFPILSPAVKWSYPAGMLGFLATAMCGVMSANSSGGEMSRPIGAASRWSATGLRVEAGKDYLFRFEPSEDLADASIRVRDLRGWPGVVLPMIFSPCAPFRRRPAEPWFALIATVEGREPRRLRPVSRSEPCLARYHARASGELVCYFNDLPGRFFLDNNHGSARLRLADDH